MTYTSLKSPENRDYTYDLNVAHLYGNLLNTYGDNGNVLMIKYVGEKLGAKMTFDIVSVGDDFDKDHYDMVFFGGGQDYEQSIVAKDLPSKRDAIGQFIQDNKVILAICGGFQLLGQYYIQANGVRIDGIGVKSITKSLMKLTMVLKITKGVPSFLMMKNHLAKWSTVMVITRKMVLKGSTIKMFMVATSMDQFFLVTPTLPTVWSLLLFVTNMAKTLNCQVTMTFSQVRLLKNTQILNQKQNLRNNSMI